MSSKLLTNYLPEFFALYLYRKGPGKVSVNLTSRCNQRCIYCEIGSGEEVDHSHDLTFDDMIWLIDQMAGAGIRKLSLCGGEPFLFGGLIDLVAYAARKKIRCAITSNGMITHRLSDQEFRVLKESGAGVNISVDSFDDRLNSLTRGHPDALANALRSVEKLTANGIPVTVLTVVTKYNYRELSAFLVSAWERGIEQVLFQPVIYYSNYPNIPALAEKARLNVPPEACYVLLRELKQILRFERKHRINTNVYRIYPWIGAYLRSVAGGKEKWFWEDFLGKFLCREADAIIDITWDGGIQPCGLASATASIRDNRELGLIGQWKKATGPLRESLGRGKFFPMCNACCHHFSRNMLASLIRYPVKNRKALSIMLPLLASRLFFRMLKRL